MRYTYVDMFDLAIDDIHLIKSLNYCNNKNNNNICQHTITYFDKDDNEKKMLIDGNILAYWYIKFGFPVPEHLCIFVDEIKQKIKMSKLIKPNKTK